MKHRFVLHAHGDGFRRGLTAAAVALAASCPADGLPGRIPEAPQPSSLQAKKPSSVRMPKGLRAPYIAAVQRQASASYAALALGPGRILAENKAQRFAT